eukprot:681849-Hanusia_phi.AAC.3
MTVWGLSVRTSFGFGTLLPLPVACVNPLGLESFVEVLPAVSFTNCPQLKRQGLLEHYRLAPF